MKSRRIQVLIFSAIGMIIGFGTCAIGVVSMPGGDLSTVGRSLFYLSVIVFVATGLTILIGSILRRFKDE